jgi:DinB family protein
VPDEEPEEEQREEIEAAPLAEKVTGDDVTMLLLSVPERVSDLLLGLTPDQLSYRHGPAFPTASEVARHVATVGAELDAEITAVALDAPPADPPRTEELPLADVLQDWQRRRRRAADLLRGLPDDRWDDRLAELCDGGLRHELGHLSQLRNLTALIPVA